MEELQALRREILSSKTVPKTGKFTDTFFSTVDREKKRAIQIDSILSNYFNAYLNTGERKLNKREAMSDLSGAFFDNGVSVGSEDLDMYIANLEKMLATYYSKF